MNTNNIKIRLATFQDLESVVEIYNQGVDSGFSTFDDFYISIDRYVSYLTGSKKRAALLVAVFEEQVIGWASIDPISERNAYRFTCLGSVYVRKEFRGMSVGRLLKKEKIIEASKLDYHSMICEVLSINKVSIILNLSLGFRIVGEIVQAGYRNDKWIGLIVMQKFLKHNNYDN